MSDDNIDGAPEDTHHNEAMFRTVQHNPDGPWAHLEDETVQNNIAKLSGEHHGACRAEDLTFTDFPTFLDAFTAAWLEQKAKVEAEAQKYGFVPCESTATLSAEDRAKAAVLVLTLNGSFVLLGNGCLAYHGGSGRYEKIPYRKSGASLKSVAPQGIVVNGEAELQKSIVFSNRDGFDFIKNTSPLQALYFTTRNLPAEDALELGNALSDSIADFGETLRDFGNYETIQDVPIPERPQHEDDLPEPGDIPERQPEYEPAH